MMPSEHHMVLRGLSLRRPAAALGVLIALGIVPAVACGSDTKSAPPPATATSVPSPRRPEPTIDGNRVTFPFKRYGAVIPDGWEFDANDINFDTISADTYFAPAGTANVRTSIAVTCETIPEGTSGASYADAKASTAERFSASGVQRTSRRVAGRDAVVLEYRQRVGADEIGKSDVVLVNGSCGFTITLTAPSADLAGLAPLFETFLTELTLS